MTSEPKIEIRKAQRYAAINTKIKMKEIPLILPPLIPEIFSCLEKKGLKPAGAPFFSYSKIEGKEIEVEVGIPVDTIIAKTGRVSEGIFPGGRYAVIKHTGHYNNLYQAHQSLEEWSEKNQINFEGARIEFYLAETADEMNPDNWETIIIQKIKD
jgi:effector-binding domain-containing protein